MLLVDKHITETHYTSIRKSQSLSNRMYRRNERTCIIHLGKIPGHRTQRWMCTCLSEYSVLNSIRYECPGSDDVPNVEHANMLAVLYGTRSYKMLDYWTHSCAYPASMYICACICIRIAIFSSTEALNDASSCNTSHFTILFQHHTLCACKQTHQTHVALRLGSTVHSDN